ncbi:dienelactone hydrolase family protein [Pantoea sp. Acro-805]|uniref:Dienelactone hydrolase family protein n=1 Tax=Candidatus Pantoea formicae TaxID=2608355 RepID=A0ABX0QPZ1_9GAMM|nr:dienelactone hydrolase family protein [Pantoea formicae]MDF7647798.1 dienelactone hydrolase family protein [Erwiniaceae bacterium L1_54_3]NIE99133.1 dienelactone hydrolase family protein [Pantoea formicae]
MSNIHSTSLSYTVGNDTFDGILIYNADINAPQPGIVIAPNWMGATEDAAEQAKAIAAKGYVVLVADLYGQGKRPTSGDEAGAMMMEVKDKPAEVTRMQAALTALRTQRSAPVQTDKVAAIGFCFGGHCALELARSGADIKAAVSFHGTLDTQGAYNGNTINASLLVLDGAADPLVPREQLAAFASEMNSKSVDWQLVSFAGAVHSFTDPKANNTGVAQYHPEVTQRAFKRMYQLLDEVF